MNSINLVGRITKDLELRSTPNDKSVCEFSLAVNRIGSEGTDFINCQVWSKQAENLVKYQGKGSLIGISGQLRVETYKGKDDKTRYKTYVLANNIEYLETKKQEAAPVETKVQEQPKVSNEVVNDPFEQFGNEVTLTDDDLPF